jgi:hypothetical protein
MRFHWYLESNAFWGLQLTYAPSYFMNVCLVRHAQSAFAMILTPSVDFNSPLLAIISKWSERLSIQRNHREPLVLWAGNEQLYGCTLHMPLHIVHHIFLDISCSLRAIVSMTMLTDGTITRKIICN